MTPNITDFVTTFKCPGRLIYAKVWGSHSHNTALPTSDVDYLVVYAAPIREILGLHPPADTVETHEPDVQAHEVAKFAGLLLKGNPGIVEMLFTERMQYETSWWRDLKDHRRKFLCARTLKQYLGYAQGQLHRLKGHQSVHSKGGEPNEKWSYHLMRILQDAWRIARGEEPTVWKECHEQEFLMQIRSGKFTVGEVEERAVQAIADIDARRPWPIPDEPDEQVLNDWLLRVRGVE